MILFEILISYTLGDHLTDDTWKAAEDDSDR